MKNIVLMGMAVAALVGCSTQNIALGRVVTNIFPDGDGGLVIEKCTASVDLHEN